MSKPRTPYVIMSSILKPHDKPTLEEAKTINTFFFARWLSNNRFTTPIAHILNTYYNIPPEVQLRFAQDYSDLTGLPGKVKFIGFNKEKRDPNMQKLLDNISRYYKINEIQSEEYFNLMNDTERDRLFNMYAEGMIK